MERPLTDSGEGKDIRAPLYIVKWSHGAAPRFSWFIRGRKRGQGRKRGAGKGDITDIHGEQADGGNK
jgi:hypothetical protein